MLPCLHGEIHVERIGCVRPPRKCAYLPHSKTAFWEISLKNSFAIILGLLLFHSLPTHAETTAVKTPSLGISDMLGQFFFLHVGSSGGSFMLTTGIRATTRNTVEVSYIRGGMGWGDSNVLAINPEDEKVDVNSFRINCKDKTYAPDSYATDGYRTKEFLRGAAYKWGDYSANDFMASSDRDTMTVYMQRVCDFTSQF